MSSRRTKDLRPRGPARGRNPSRRSSPSDGVLLYGIHAVAAALANPHRRLGRLLVTENALRRLETRLGERGASFEVTSSKELDRLVGSDVVHQGVVLEADPLPPVGLDEINDGGLLLILDQVTDPQNVGAALRSAAVFGATGLLMPWRNSPPLSGALAKAASGALDLVPVILVGNLAQALAELGERGFLRVGLAEEAGEPLETARLELPLALVLGAEGKGLRQLTRDRCDLLCRISTEDSLASLNVANAAAIALHWARMISTSLPRR